MGTYVETEDGNIALDLINEGEPSISLQFIGNEFAGSDIKKLDYDAARKLAFVLIGMTDAWAKNGRIHPVQREPIVIDG